MALVIILFIAYVLNHTPFHFSWKIDLIIVIFLLYLPKINNDTIVYYSLIFGFLNDYILNSYIGLSVILFIVLSAIHITMFDMFSINNVASRLLQALFILLLFNVFNLIYFGYEVKDFFSYGLLRVAVDYTVYFLIFVIMEFRSAFSYSKG